MKKNFAKFCFDSSISRWQKPFMFRHANVTDSSVSREERWMRFVTNYSFIVPWCRGQTLGRLASSAHSTGHTVPVNAISRSRQPSDFANTLRRLLRRTELASLTQLGLYSDSEQSLIAWSPRISRMSRINCSINLQFLNGTCNCQQWMRWNHSIGLFRSK